MTTEINVPAKEYSYSTDEETYQGRFDSVDAALAEALDNADLEPGDVLTVWVGEVGEVEVESLIHIDHILEGISIAAGDEVGEAAEDWLMSVSEENADELLTLIADWVRRVERPHFWRVENVVQHGVKKEG